jgi:NAD(P)-dependent dehydrogenase (short-subunit alcohol dehydrogenase family)
MKLKGRVAIVTGGGRGIGREIAMAYAEEGADLTVVARTIAEVEQVAKEIEALGRRALAISTDVRREEQVDQMVKSTLEKFDKVDILVNNAGGVFGAVMIPVWNISLQQWQTTLGVNLKGTFLCIKAVVPHMIKQHSGSIINLSTYMAQPGERAAGFGAYAASKFGVEGLTAVLTEELAEHNIRVNTLRPGGPVATRNVLDSVDVTKVELPYGPVVRTDIVKHLALFLASDDSVGMTGESLECKKWNLEHGYGDASQYWYGPAKKY